MKSKFIQGEDLVRIKGLQKLTLLDYKGYLAATIFTGGCNFTCPFCQNKELVLYPNAVPNIPEAEVYHFLESRKGRLEAVCITGGEPTLQQDLTQFIEKVRTLGYKVKLDTNGTNPTKIKELLDNNLVDYIAMDIKNSWNKYNISTDTDHISKELLNQSIDYIMQSNCDYEFRTTIMRELHTKEDILSICKRIQGAKAYYIQPYRESPEVIHPVYSSYSRQELEYFLHIATPYVKKCAIIGL